MHDRFRFDHFSSARFRGSLSGLCSRLLPSRSCLPSSDSSPQIRVPSHEVFGTAKNSPERKSCDVNAPVSAASQTATTSSKASLGLISSSNCPSMSGTLAANRFAVSNVEEHASFFSFASQAFFKSGAAASLFTSEPV